MKRLLILTAALSLSACGLHPLYSGGIDGPVAARLAQIEVAPIEGQSGWLVGNALRDRIGAARNAGSPTYRLVVKLDDSISGLGVRQDDSIARERRTLRARYQLVEIGNGTVLLDATAGSDAGIDVVGSEYATIAAEQTALENLSNTIADQIVARVALYAQRTSPRP